ncbi:MAG TPA: sialidase family protein [Gemmatimonadales bacterium]|nr:sialidase family protein [Gemmatimonadales bacterium]
MYQAGPTIERTRNGRLWAAWTSGGPDEGPFNYVLLTSSDDGGHTWSEARLVIDPPGNVSASSPLLWYDDGGRLWLFWTQGYADAVGSRVWAIVADNVDSAAPTWSRPMRIADGRVSGKPLVVANGAWLLPIHSESGAQDFDEALGFYHLGLSPCVVATLKKEDASRIKGALVYRSTDQGRSWELLGQANLPPRATAKGYRAVEQLIVERRNGTLWMLARTPPGIGQSVSQDDGKTWTEIQPSGIRHPLTRFFIRRLRSGRLLMVRHDPPSVEYPKNCNDCGELNRSHLKAYVSDDDGNSWRGGLLLDDREKVSYPDGTQAADGTIFIVYDHDRRTAREILLASFTEEDILQRHCIAHACSLRTLVSRGSR